jgi:hypothetical protein
MADTLHRGRLLRKDTTVTVGSAPGESGVSLLHLRFQDSAHFLGTARQHLGGEIEEQRHVRQVVMLLQAHLHERDDLLVPDPIRPRHLPVAPWIGAMALDLAALARELDRGRDAGGAAIAGHDLATDQWCSNHLSEIQIFFVNNNRF